MASIFKTKVAMLDIVKKFANELSQMGFRVDASYINEGCGQHVFYIDDDCIGNIYFQYQKENRSMRRIITHFNYTVKIYHNITYDADKVEEEFVIRMRDGETRYITEDTVDILYDIKNMLKDVYRNYKKAQNKIKELKMVSDFSE